MLTVTINNTIDDYAGAINEAAGLIASGTGTFSAAYAAGTATVSLAGFTASRVLKVGSRVIVPGHTYHYTVITGDITASAGGALASVILDRGLDRAVVSGETVIVDQTYVPIDGLESAATYPGAARFLITGDPTVYELVRDATTSSGAFLAEIRPALRQAVADNAVVTFYPPQLMNAGAGKAGMLLLTVSGIAGGAVLTIKGSIDGGVTLHTVAVSPVDTLTPATTITADGAYRVDATGWTQLYAPVTTAGTGTTTIKVEGTVG